MTLYPGGKPNTNALLSVGPAQAPWLEVGYPQMPDTGFWDWFLRDQPMVERMQEGLTPAAQEPPPAPPGPGLPAPGPPRMLYAEGAWPGPWGSHRAIPGEPPAPVDPAFLGVGQPGAGDAVAPPASAMFGQSLGGQGPSGDNDWLGSAGSWLAEQAGIVGRGAMGLGEAWMEHATGEGPFSPRLGAWRGDPILDLFGVEAGDPLGLAPESALAGQGLSPLQEAFAARRAAGGGGQPGAGNRPAGPGGTGSGAGAGGGGGGSSYSLGRYQAPPPVPTRALPNAPDLSGVLSEIEGAAPQRPEEETGTDWGELLGGAAAAASQLGPRAGVGDILLAMGGGMSAVTGQRKREAKREDRYYDEQEREHRLRVADAKLKGVEIGSEYEQKRADVDYDNRLGEWKREAAILDAHQPQVQMTQAGLLIQDIGPDGERRIRVDNRPVAELLEMRAALKGLGAGKQTVNQFTRSQLNPDSPEDLALSWATDLMDSPDMWPMVYGDKFGQFNQEINSIIGQKDATGAPTAFGAYASNLTGKEGNAMQGQLAQRALVRKLWIDMMNNPDMQKRYMALQAGTPPAPGGP